VAANLRLNYFAFEHEARDHISNLVKPVCDRQLEDRVRLEGIDVHLSNVSDRLEAIEVLYNMKKGKNVMLDALTDRINQAVSHSYSNHLIVNWTSRDST
jgi:hypothetical protein